VAGGGGGGRGGGTHLTMWPPVYPLTPVTATGPLAAEIAGMAARPEEERTAAPDRTRSTRHRSAHTSAKRCMRGNQNIQDLMMFDRSAISDTQPRLTRGCA
jgi:hypothetical protein